MIFDPATTNCPGGANCTRQPFPNNLIPAGRISSASKFFQEPMPAPTHAGIANNFLSNNRGVGFNNFNVNVKTDFNASDAHRFSVLFSRGSHTSKQSPSAAIRFRCLCPTLSRVWSGSPDCRAGQAHLGNQPGDDEPDQLWRIAPLDSDHQPDD